MATEVIPFAQHTAASTPEQVRFDAVSGNRFVAELHVQSAPGNYMSIHVIDWATKSVLKSLYPPPAPTAQGFADTWSLRSESGDGIDPTQFGVLFDHANDRWQAYAVVR